MYYNNKNKYPYIRRLHFYLDISKLERNNNSSYVKLTDEFMNNYKFSGANEDPISFENCNRV